MKTSAILNVLCLTACGSAAAIRPRDGPIQGSRPSLFDAGGPAQKAMKIEKLIPLIDPQATRIKLTYGPYKIKAANDNSKVGNGRSMDPHGTGYSHMADDDFPTDVTVLEAKSEMVDEQFKKVDLAEGLYNHHNVFAAANRTSMPLVQCDGAAPKSGMGGMGGGILMAGTNEMGVSRYAVKGGSIKSGFYLGKNDKIKIMVDMVNYQNNERTVYSVSEIEYLPGKSAGLLLAEYKVIDIGACGGQNGTSIHAPKGQTKFSVTGKEIKIAQDGYLINYRGHMHDGAKDIEMKINGKQVCHSKAVYGGPGHEGVGHDGKPWASVSETTECPKEIKVNKGDKMVIHASYDIEAHPERESAHGEMAEGMALLIGTWVSAKPM